MTLLGKFQDYTIITVLPVLMLCVMLIYGITYILVEHFGGRSAFYLLWWFQWGITGFLSIVCFYHVVLCHVDGYTDLFDLTIPYMLPIEFGFIIDGLSVKMGSLVLFISFFVQFFSFEYMRDERRLIKFMVTLHAFTWFMLLFVFSNNLLLSFSAWEGLGFVSFILINFWDSRPEANKAAFKAVIFNRISDVWFVLSMLICLIYFNTVDFCVLNGICYASHHIFIFIPFFGNVYSFNLIALSIFLAAIGKSAQIGYHAWLTAAMEGPSPVSALLHSATMVTAGVYLVLRCSDIFNNCSLSILHFIIIVGITTCFFCGCFAFYSTDFKRIVAYSTCSHLGLMFCFIGFSFFEVSELHLHIHAFFKTTLFLCAGLIMATVLHVQNFRKISSFALFFPICNSLLSFAGVSLLGAPFTLGSVSKERFVVLGYSNVEFVFTFKLYFIAAIVALFVSLLYTLKLLLNIGYRPGFNGERRLLFFLSIESFGLWLSQFILCTSIFILYAFLARFYVRGLVALDPWSWLNVHSMYYNIHINMIPAYVKFFMLILLVFLYCIYANIQFFFLVFRFKYPRISDGVERFINTAYYPLNLVLHIFGVPRILNFITTLFINFEVYIASIYSNISGIYNKSSQILYIAWEHGVLEILGPIGAVRLFKKLSLRFNLRFFSGDVVMYLNDFLFVLFFISIIFTLYFCGVDSIVILITALLVLLSYFLLP